MNFNSLAEDLDLNMIRVRTRFYSAFETRSESKRVSEFMSGKFFG